jgi:uncharacterized protein (UPF0332 family)
MVDAPDALRRKALASLAGAESEFAAGRYDNAANRGYYACFQAAVAALRHAGVTPPSGGGGQWSHSAVQAQFVGRLINRRKLYPGDLRDVLSTQFAQRQTAAYDDRELNEAETARLLRQARRFVAIVPAPGDQR